MSLSQAVATCSGFAKRLLGNVYNSTVQSKNLASGRWYPQPANTAGFCSKAGSVEDSLTGTHDSSIAVNREDAAPMYYRPKGDGSRGYGLVTWKNGEQIANYVLFEDSINKASIPWNTYNGLTSEERGIHMKHLQAIEERKLGYTDPVSKLYVFTVSHHLNKGKCCGSGCRHCPYEMENVKEDVKRSKVWNGAFYV